MKIIKVRSGGQTGVDRAALDAARELGLPIAGWCPRGGRAEDHENPNGGGITQQYPELRQTNYPGYSQRTVLNIWDADATIIISPGDGKVSPGTQLTIDEAKRQKKPYYLLRDENVMEVLKWLNKNFKGDIEINFAGPRASSSPGVYEVAKRIVKKIIS
jgi:hypothetical protein